MSGDSFLTTYIAGGKLDKLPYPLFPRKKIPHVLGKMVSIPSTPGKYETTVTTAVNSEYLCIAIACSAYTIGDYWELSIGDKKICETIYVKGLPESIAVGNTMVLVYPIPAGTVFTFTYNNSSNVEKDVFFNLHFLE